MPVVTDTLYEIAMSQYAIDVNQTWTAVHWLSALEKRPPNSQQRSALHIIITALEVHPMVIMTQMFNCWYPPVNQTTLPNYLKLQGK